MVKPGDIIYWNFIRGQKKTYNIVLNSRLIDTVYYFFKVFDLNDNEVYEYILTDIELENLKPVI